MATCLALAAPPTYAERAGAATPGLARPLIVERTTVDAFDGKLPAGSLVITARMTGDVPNKAGTSSADLTAEVHGLGPMIQMGHADYSTETGHCYNTLPARRKLMHWRKGRRVTVTLRVGDGAGHYDRITRRVEVIAPLNHAPSKDLGCFSAHL